MKAVVIANGEIPSHPIPLKVLQNADHIVCLDGAVEQLLALGYEPDVIVGDLDSITPLYFNKYKNIIVKDDSEEYNDLQKGIKYCISKQWYEIDIIGAFGLREDHSLANLSILLYYANPNHNLSDKELKIRMVTNSGVFTPIFSTTAFHSFPKQPVSIFSHSAQTELTFYGLKYPVQKATFSYFWEGSLNSAIGDVFVIEFEKGEVLVYQSFDML
ncbi:MAG TPA: thiamine diphosphokinase [Bacteroidales bacterium]|nr:thiamine diphosphokinase [Bacteroidales bacterium]HOH22560.1 thiamine diphosphokinase [Bacteroidales bacterium]HPB58040.1 thiamine diphosphokinase [Bacteroidales bacterium]HPZ02813.1 thiamine diphosphokinase [Bacteroidales bacterium]HQB74304.1 thiamine diphosphokinase [Bacteroidales bacterium]